MIVHRAVRSSGNVLLKCLSELPYNHKNETLFTYGLRVHRASNKVNFIPKSKMFSKVIIAAVSSEQNCVFQLLLVFSYANQLMVGFQLCNTPVSNFPINTSLRRLTSLDVTSIKFLLRVLAFNA